MGNSCSHEEEERYCVRKDTGGSNFALTFAKLFQGEFLSSQ